MKKWIWLSYDLGVNGDYENFYRWLDVHQAKECGDSVALLAYPTRGNLINNLKADLKKNIRLRERDRIYVGYKSDDGTLKGQFIFGGRKPAPWKGYADQREMAVDDELLAV